ncbi:hypothetical protein [Zobellia galactanivorans]|uniref:hypothetical protein n=1 Tax=Zobellia galactanivorans (strain DSM 12802 / CCUG 47099 / CIP 106680 / NCIMB 13871 / Dsij) TaxID=63186 RepID=UPI0011DE2EAB|nr:hypothetical protein [Zobellia galactanivorans]
MDEKPVPDPQHPEVIEAENLPEEKLYFDSYLLPLEDAYKLQEALDTYGSVRLEKGTYPGTEITLKTGQRLFGHPSVTKYNNTITIKAGSSNVRVQNMYPQKIVFESGSTIKNSTFKSIRNTRLNCDNCILEDNTFINLDDCSLRFDCSVSGYFRNNKFIKLRSHALSNQTIMKGNSITPSYGNVVLWRNYLIPSGNATDFSNLESFTLVGFDAESWNYNNQGNKPLLYMREMGDVKLGSMSGLNHGKSPTPVFDIEAENLIMFGKDIYSKSSDDIVRSGTNMMMISGKHEDYVYESSPSSIDFKAYFNSKDLYLNENKIDTEIASNYTDQIRNNLVDKRAVPWEKPFFPNLPKTVSDEALALRGSKTDRSSEIQELIEKNDIAQLKEGVYYISKPIVIKRNQGIIGMGSGKTAIVGITDDFPLIFAQDDVSHKSLTSSKYFLAHMTLQGGNTGFYVNPIGKENHLLQLTSCTFKNLIFRDQKKGIHFDKFYGVDNNFFDQISFVDCEIGLFQEPDPTFDMSKGETTTMMYMDKNVFYNCQIIRCGVGFSMLSKRPNNLNAWIDSSFDGNGISVDLENQINAIFANSIFKNHTGDYIIGKEKSASFYGCKFYNNSSTKIFELRKTYIEGSSFEDNSPLFLNLSSEVFMLNTEVNGGLGTMSDGLLMNNVFKNNTSLSNLIVEMRDEKIIQILSGTGTGKPQFLVKLK